MRVASIISVNGSVEVALLNNICVNTLLYAFHFSRSFSKFTEDRTVIKGQTMGEIWNDLFKWSGGIYVLTRSNRE